MRYNQPFGSVDPNAGYKDRNTAMGQPGSKVPAMAIEAPQREIMAVIQAAGLDPTNNDLTQLLQAINKIIDAATGGAGDENYVLMTQARGRLPIFPEVMTADGKLPVFAPSAGVVRIPAGYSFIHRGVFLSTTIQQDFVTVANKTYHLRWRPNTGFSLYDLSDAGYNPAAVAETAASLDSKYDDMLIASVVTNASNGATVRNLANKNILEAEYSKTTYETAPGGGADGRGPNTAPVLTVDWSRKPHCLWQEFKIGPATENLVDGVANVFFESTRYTARPQVTGFFSGSSSGTVDGTYRVLLRA